MLISASAHSTLSLTDQYCLHRSLYRGTTSRSALPLEVVNLIFRLTSIKRPSLDLGWAWKDDSVDAVEAVPEEAVRQPEEENEEQGKGDENEREVEVEVADKDEKEENNTEGEIENEIPDENENGNAGPEMAQLFEYEEDEESDDGDDEEDEDEDEDEDNEYNSTESEESISDDSEKADRRLVFQSPSITGSMSFKMASILVETLAKDRGWASWFEVGIVGEPYPNPPDTELPIPEEQRFYPKVHLGKRLSWLSHCNDINTLKFKRYSGNDEYGPCDEICKHLREGDRIGVWMVSPLGAPGDGPCIVKEVRIMVWEWFEPSFV